jgi:hypothetical protein
MSTLTVPQVTGTSPLPDPILYTLYYRQGANPHPNFVSFYLHTKDMKVVAERAKRHCEVMNYRFVYVKQAIIDLDREENILLQREDR